MDKTIGEEDIRNYPDLTGLYRFPFTATDNANTVIEPTTRCNLACPGCYRRTELANNEERDKSLDEMRQYIDDVARLRNCSCISFLGGEALLHPRVNEAIAYAKQRGFNAGLYTNGLLLNEQRLRELKDLEVSYVMVHVDKHQGRGDTEEEINQIREHFCGMFRRVGGVQLGFAFQLMEKDLHDIPVMVACFTGNVDVVRVVGFSVCTNTTASDATRSYEERCMAERVLCKAVADAYGLEWCSYLGTRYDKTMPGKITAWNAYHDGKFLGSVDGNVIREKIMWAYEKYGKYPYIDMMPSLYMDTIEGKTIHWQNVSISFSPMLAAQGVNFCDSCTDALLYNGKFTPMCYLEYAIRDPRWNI